MFIGGDGHLREIRDAPREMDFVESSRSVRDRILGVFGVPPAVLGLAGEKAKKEVDAALDIFLLSREGR